MLFCCNFCITQSIHVWLQLMRTRQERVTCIRPLWENKESSHISIAINQTELVAKCGPKQLEKQRPKATAQRRMLWNSCLDCTPKLSTPYIRGKKRGGHPLLWSVIVILPSFFKFCDFALYYSQVNAILPLVKGQIRKDQGRDACCTSKHGQEQQKKKKVQWGGKKQL